MRPKRALLFWMNARQREREAAAARVMQQASARRQRMQKRVMQAVCLAVATQEQRLFANSALMRSLCAARGGEAGMYSGQSEHSTPSQKSVR